MSFDPTPDEPVAIATVIRGRAEKTHGRYVGGVGTATPCGKLLSSNDRVTVMVGRADKVAAIDCKGCQRTDWFKHRQRLENHPPNAIGRIPHAEPTEIHTDGTHAPWSSCKICGAEVFEDGEDGVGNTVWSHTATLDYFCEV